MKIEIDTIKSQKRGRTRSTTSYFRVSSSTPGSAYEVSIGDVDYWCTCRGNLSKASLASRQGVKRTHDRADLMCKHVRTIVQDSDILAAGREVRKLALSS